MTSCANQIDPDEFLKRVNYLRGHLEAVGRMVEDGRDPGEILRQMRAVRRTAEKLELQCLLSYLATDTGDIRKIIELYRLANR